MKQPSSKFTSSTCGYVHGEARSGTKPPSRLYGIWGCMKIRCESRNKRTRANYHDRGIRVCDEWQKDYVAFRDWALTNGYRDDLTIDRINNDGGYSPENCRWVDYKTQRRNTRINLHLTAFGETKTAADWIDDPRCQVRRITFYGRIHRGWPVEKAITLPASRLNRVVPVLAA